MTARWAKLGAMTAMVAALAIGASGCAAETDDSADDGTQGDDAEVIARDPNAIPKPMLTFLSQQGWGKHHLEWHTVRQWDLLSAEEQGYAKRQHWARAEMQEGTKGNGLEFLAMHRVMIRLLSEKFPRNVDLFKGFDKPPLECDDKADPCGPEMPGPFDANKAKAIDKLQNHLADFKNDDELGLYLESSLRPTASKPDARSSDRSAGIHNYLHGRFMDSRSKIDVGDPSVNLQNKKFWRIHGWIENRWTEFRKLKHLSEQDPAYAAAIKKGEDMFTVRMKGPLPDGASNEAPPDSLRKRFFKEP
jgi:hypothetical protein